MEASVPTAAYKPIRYPWFTIWIAPRTTIRSVLDSDPKRLFLTLGILAGIERFLWSFSTSNAGDHYTLPLILAGSVIFGPLLNLAVIYLKSAILTWTGRWIGGKGSHAEIRATFVWSGIPEIAGISYWLLGFATFGDELFTSATPRIDGSTFLSFQVVAFQAVLVVLALWGFVLFVICLAEAHRFPVWKAFLNLLLALVVVALPVVALLMMAT